MSREWDEQAKANAATLEGKIRLLEATETGFITDLTEIFVNRDYGKFWGQVKETNELFKSLKPIKKEDREQLWERLNRVCEEVKRKQNQEYETKGKASKSEKDIIRDLVKQAHNWGDGARETEDIRQGNSRLRQAMDKLKGNRVLLKQDHEECFQAWEEAKNALNYGRERILENNWNHIHSDINDILHKAQYGNPYEAQDDIKEFNKSTMKGVSLSSGKYQEARDLLDLAWRTASERIAEEKRGKNSRAEEWRSRQESHIERWQTSIEKAEATISRIQDEIRDCGRMQSEAATSEFADTVQGWIYEKEEKIRVREDSIRDLEGKIRDVEQKLRE